MVKRISAILILLMLKGIISFGQKHIGSVSCVHQLDTLTGIEIYKQVDKPPEPIGGLPGLYSEISRKIVYPQSAKAPVESKVFVAFVIREDGSIAGKRILRNIQGTNFAEQLLDIATRAHWTAGECHGKKVPVLQLMPMIVDIRN